MKSKNKMSSNIIYNVTIKVDNGILDEWKTWMKESHIPDVMATSKFMDWQMAKVLGDEDPEATTIAVQYRAENMDTFMEYQQFYAQGLQEKHKARYEGKYYAFRTLLEVM